MGLDKWLHPVKDWGVINHSFMPNYNVGFGEPLKLEYGRIIT